MLYKIKRCRNRLSLKFGRFSRELRLFQEKKVELENWRRRLAELDHSLNQVVVQNNRVFEENRQLLEDLVTQKWPYQQ